MTRLLKLAVTSVLALVVLALPAFAQGTGMIFVSNEKSHEIVVLSPEHEIIKRIETSQRPRDMHFNADRTLLFVACGDDDVIDVIDMATLEVVDSIPTGPSPEVFAFSPDESLIYVSNEENSTLEVLERETGITVADIPTGAEPEGVILTPDGSVAYVTSEVADMIHVVDTSANVVTKNILVGTRPRRFIMAPDESEIWVSAELSSEIYVIDMETNEVSDVLEFLPPGFRPEDVTPVGMAITADGSKVLISLGRANHIAVVDRVSRETLSYVLVGSRAWSVALNRDETIAIVANGLSDDITVVDMESMRPVESIPVGRVPHTVLIDD